MMFVCTNNDVSPEHKELKVQIPGLFKKLDVRSELLGIWGIIQLANNRMRRFAKFRDMDILMHYGTCTVVSKGKRRTPLDVKKSIDDWMAAILVLATTHEKEDIDKAEFKMDELLTPMLTAPVAQLREFHQGLTVALREDKRIPFFMWSTFNAWSKNILDQCEGVPELKRLRKKLANEIAEMVDEEVKPDIAKAIAGALQWRDPETLKDIKADLKAGAKPRLQGKESCLFLTTKKPGRGQKEHTVML